MPTNMSTPVPPPGNNSYNPWHDYDVNSVDDMGVNAAEMGDIDSLDLNRVAANVGGIAKESDPTEWATEIPELTDPLEEETNEFIDAYNTGTEDSGLYAWDDSREAGTMGAARQAKREDRRADREARQEMRQDMQDELYEKYRSDEYGLSKGEARRKARRESRRAKRALRQGQRD